MVIPIGTNFACPGITIGQPSCRRIARWFMNFWPRAHFYRALVFAHIARWLTNFGPAAVLCPWIARWLMRVWPTAISRRDVWRILEPTADFCGWWISDHRRFLLSVSCLTKVLVLNDNNDITVVESNQFNPVVWDQSILLPISRRVAHNAEPIAISSPHIGTSLCSLTNRSHMSSLWHYHLPSLMICSWIIIPLPFFPIRNAITPSDNSIHMTLPSSNDPGIWWWVGTAASWLVEYVSRALPAASSLSHIGGRFIWRQHALLWIIPFFQLIHVVGADWASEDSTNTTQQTTLMPTMSSKTGLTGDTSTPRALMSSSHNAVATPNSSLQGSRQSSGAGLRSSTLVQSLTLQSRQQQQGSITNALQAGQNQSQAPSTRISSPPRSSDPKKDKSMLAINTLGLLAFCASVIFGAGAWVGLNTQIRQAQASLDIALLTACLEHPVWHTYSL